ncbi:hypothetical protein CVT24_003274 [Panaeolus cyanescens]|uniref:Uncharacterized protein n=1 Tax=Panaeolus cyanescens TaxID=181874 RepID=A0A409YR95_9AGAR|nr:hypothetical protein CVT24_003274 [Panaeolus cyanescens]
MSTAFLNLPSELYDEIADICYNVGGHNLLRKCALVHPVFLPRVYSYFFNHISFYSSTALAKDVRESRIASFIDILHNRPFVAQLVKCFTLYLHMDNDWLVDEKDSNFPELIRVLKEFGAQPISLTIHKLPGSDFIYLPHPDKFNALVIQPLFAQSVKTLTIGNCDLIHPSTLSAFNCLEDVTFDKVGIWDILPSPGPPQKSLKLPRIRALKINAFLTNDDGSKPLVKFWRALPFDFSALQRLQLPLEAGSDAADMYPLLRTPRDVLRSSSLREVRLLIKPFLEGNETTLDDLDFSRTAGIDEIRLTINLRDRIVAKIDLEPFIQALHALISTKLNPSLKVLIIDFAFGTSFQCQDAISRPYWSLFEQEIGPLKSHHPPSPGRHRRVNLDARFNFAVGIASAHGLRHGSLPNDWISDAASTLEYLFPNWFIHMYEVEDNQPFRNCIRLSVHSTWPKPLVGDELSLLDLR